MNSNPLISVIVPVYNTETLLSACIESVLHQTYTSFELLLVDDGSTDRSGDICEEYAKRDSRIRVFHKQNGGPGSAKNMGLDNCAGDLICFVDSDDTVDEDYLLKPLNCMLETGSDVVGFNLSAEKKVRYADTSLFFSDLMKDELGGHLWRYLYKKSLWEGKRMPASRTAEDASVIYRVFYGVENISFLDEQLYHYYYSNPDNVSNSKKNRLRGTVDRALMFMDRLVWMQENAYDYPGVRETVMAKATGFSIGAMGLYKRYPHTEDDIQRITSFLKDNYREIMGNKQVSAVRKIAVSLICVSPGAYYFLRNIGHTNP